MKFGFVKRKRKLSVIIFLLIFSCEGEKEELNPFEDGPYGVGVTTITFYDTSRTIESGNSFPEQSSRILVTEIWYPSLIGDVEKPERNAPPYLPDAPYPLVVFAHGAMSYRTQSAFLCKHLASHGYVVMAPDFPLSSFKSFLRMSPSDVINQPGDVSFLITETIRQSREKGNLLSNIIDEKEIGITGHSLGGLTSILTGFYDGLKDERVKAVVPISPFACFFTEETFKGKSLPLLFIGGDRDMFVDFEANLSRIYEYAEPPKYLITLKGGTHVGSLEFNISESLAFAFFSGMMKAMRSEERADEFYEILDLLGDPSRCPNLTETYPEEATGVMLWNPEDFMPPERQRKLEKAFILSFFNLYLKGDKRWGYILTEGYVKKFKDVEIRALP